MNSPIFVSNYYEFAVSYRGVPVIYAFDDYRSFFAQRIEQDPKRWGMKSRLAEHLGCQTGFVSQVLTGSSHFSSHHLLLCAGFFSLTEDETDYLFLLEQYQKAGSSGLAKYYLKKIKERQVQQKKLQPKAPKQIPIAEATEVFGDPIYITLLAAVSCKSYKSIQALSERFQIDTPRLLAALSKLESLGLIYRNKVGYSLSPDSSRLHFPKASPISAMHLMNWRIEAKKHFQNESARNYSIICGVSQQGADEIQNLIKDLTVKIDKIIENSIEEEVYCLNLDFFRV